MTRSVALVFASALFLGGEGALAGTLESYSFTNLDKSVPDGNGAGMSDARAVSSAIRAITGVRVRLHIVGEFNGDLYGYLRHVQGATTNLCVLLNRPGRTVANAAGYQGAGVDVVFDDAALSGNIHAYASVTNIPPGMPLTGTWQPDGRKVNPTQVLDTTPVTSLLSGFNGSDASGLWTLFLADMACGGTNMLVSWGLDITGLALPGVTWPTPVDIVYGTVLGAGQLDASASVPGTFTYSPSVGTVLNAGNAQTLTVIFTPSDSSSYLSVTSNVSISVSKRTLTVTACCTNKVYGAALPGLTASYSGFVNEDTVGSLSAAAVLGTTASAGSVVGTYPITATGASGANYTISYVGGTLTVTPAGLTITALNTNKVYGAALPGLTASYNGFVNGDTVGSLSAAAVLGTTATAGSGVGTYPITATGASGANYTISYVGGTLTVTPAGLTITVLNTNKVYGAALPGLTASYNGFVNGDTVSTLSAAAVLGTTATAGSRVGTYPITASGASGANYTISYVGGTLTVTPAGLTITALNTNKVYGAALPGLTASYNGFVNGDTVGSLSAAAVLGTTATAGSRVGTYPITASGASGANYTISYVGGTLTVTPAGLTITALNTNEVYGAALPGLTASYSGFVNGDTVSTLSAAAVLGTTASAGSGVGTYPITASGASGTNYAISYVGGTLTIVKASTLGIMNSSRNPSPTGQSVAFTLALNAVAPGAGTPTGTVQFKADGANVGGAMPINAGGAIYTTSTLTHGSHTVAAEYAGDGNFVGTTNGLSPNQLVNNSPVAGADTIGRWATAGTKVSVGALLTNDSDPDGDAISMMSVSSTSTNGGSVTWQGQWIFYTPLAGDTNTDLFTYTIADSFGATATGTVLVEVMADAVPSPNLTITNLGGGSYLIQFDGIPGANYGIEYSETSTNLVWLPLGTASADPMGLFHFIDIPSGTSGQRFYRSVWHP